MHTPNDEPALLALTAPIDAEVDAAIAREVPRDFGITDERSANWFLRRVLTARAYGERVKIWAEQEQRRAQREEQTLLFLFGRQLESWTAAEIAKLNGRRKSISLPAGVCGFRQVPQHVEVVDEQTVIAWARLACPAAIVATEKLLRTPVIQHIEQTGEVPDGIEIVPPTTKFFVR